MKKERGPQATKNTRPMAGTVGASRAFSVRQVMTVRNGKTAAETDRSRGEARQRDFITDHSSIMAGFYEPRATIFSRAEGYSRRPAGPIGPIYINDSLNILDLGQK